MASSFDGRAETWDDDPRRVRRAEQAAEVIRDTLEVPPTARLLEFGAGTGLLAQALAGDVGRVVLADPSAGMRAVAEVKAAAGVFGPEAQVVDPATALDASHAGVFDLLVSLMAFHHIEDLPTTLGSLHDVLAPGGRLAAIDLEKDVDRSYHDEAFAGYHGFDRSEIAGLLWDAGFTEVRIRHCLAMPKRGRTYDLFLATARKRG